VPIYEYRCQDCRRRISIHWRSFAEPAERTAICPRCGSTNLTRLVSRVRVIRSEDSRLDDVSDMGDFPEPDENDPRSLGRWMRKMKDEMGDEVGDDMGGEFDEVVGRLESGQNPEDIEKSMPELAGAPGEDFSDGPDL